MKRIKLFCGYNESETGYKNVLGFYNLIRKTWMYYEDGCVYDIEYDDYLKGYDIVSYKRIIKH